MNYYEHHIGDYDQATAHLSAVEDGIYSRLIRWYMAGEQPLPTDIAAIQRRVRAHSRDEKAAVKTILGEFFELLEDGYHQHRCDEEIARYQAKQEKARASANKRWANVQTASEGNANASSEHDARDMRTHSEGNAPRARPQAPSTRHQTPDPNQGVKTVSDDSTGVGAGIAQAGPTPTAAEISLVMRRAGVMSQPGDPRLMALADQGVSLETVKAACDDARRAKPNESVGPGYVVKIIERWGREAQTVNAAGAMPPVARQQQDLDAINARNNAEAKRMLFGEPGGFLDAGA